MTTEISDINPKFIMDIDVHTPGAERVLARCDTLADYTSMEGGLCRMYLTAEHRQCNSVVSNWMQEAGMKSRMDEAGNIWGHYAGDAEDAPTVILGSHLDTVPNAGKYDGILGVLVAIEIVDMLHRENIRLPFAIDVVGFGDEEGARFGATLLGSRAVVGRWQEPWFGLTDEHEISLARAMDNFGLSPSDVYFADRSQENIKAYLELHIEQGPVLEQQNQAVGVVTSIAGARRFNVRVKGMAGHAGTVPMDMRRDALIVAAQCIQEIEHIAKLSRVLATVGKVECRPGSINVIPGECEFTIDVRSGQDASRDFAVKQIFEKIIEICQEHHVEFSCDEIHNASAVNCASWIQRTMEDVIQDHGHHPVSLVSGAGHDAMVFGDITDMGMLFVRCAGGISHHPGESVTKEDVHVALNVFMDVIVRLEKGKQVYSHA